MTRGDLPRVLRRASLSCGALAAFLVILSHGPFVVTQPRDPVVPAAAKAMAPPSRDLTINGLPIRLTESRTSPCSAATWDPVAAGYCQGACTRVTERREGTSAAFAWLEEGTGLLQALSVDCGAGDAPGRATRLSVLSAAGLEDFEFFQTGPRRPRSGPIPALPGAVEVANLQSGAMTILVDRPGHPETALEELQMALLTAGWRRAGDPAAKPPQDAPPTWVFVRGPELCIAALHADGEDPLVISAYSRDGWAPETPQ